MADSDSGPGSQVNTRQQAMILDERLCPLPKTLKNRKKRRVDKVEASFSDRIPSEKGHLSLEPSRSLCDYGNRFKDCHTGHIQKNQR